MELKIAYYRNLKGLRQRELADAIGKSTRSVQQWESGDFYPTAKDIVNICNVLNVSPDDLFAWNDSRHEIPTSCGLTETEQATLDAINTLKEKGLI